MEFFEALKKSPGFVYQIGTQYYFLGKFICKPCTDIEITDTHAMYDVCSSAGEIKNASFYFQQLRAHTDFALEVPFNIVKLQKDFNELWDSLSDFQKSSLEKQYLRFAKDCGLN